MPDWTELGAALWAAATTKVDPDDSRRDDEALLEALAPPLDLFCRLYFRLEVSGLEHIPRGPALIVGNHEAGITFVQALGFGARFVLRRGTRERIVGLMHDAMFEIPGLGNLLGHVGAVRAAHHTAEEALARGDKVFVTPGGGREAFRPWTERFVIKMFGRKGWARLALRTGVPVCPVVFCGGQESFFVLWDGHRIARWLGLERRFRVDQFPVMFALPWGLAVGPLMHLPLPTKSLVRVLEPIVPEGDADDERAVAALYDRVNSMMQAAMDDLAARRSLPVLG